jgi:acetate kinase
MNILVLNCGSSSLKFQVIKTDPVLSAKQAEDVLVSGLVERIGSQALLSLKMHGRNSIKLAQPLADHAAAIRFVLEWIFAQTPALLDLQSLDDIDAVGHRVVHGGESFSHSIRITEAVLKGIEECIDLAPLHNPANIAGIHAVGSIFGADMLQVAVFDTSFHSSMADKAFLYAIPYHYYRRYKLRRYGFHGTSHRYLLERYAQLNKKPVGQCRIITLHLGNGCSACAILDGRSIATSMGLTPLEGMVMGTRCGDIDPAMLSYMSHKEGLSIDRLDDILNKHSGLLGISGITSDMRELMDEEREHDDRRAHLAIEMFIQSVRKYIGAYLVELNGAEAIVFSGGIGENSAEIRSRICQSLTWFGLNLDEDLNRRATGGFEGEISNSSSRLKAWVIPTNEELLIARDTAFLSRMEVSK